MRRRAVAAGVVACVVLFASTACSLFDDDKEAEPVATRIPTEPPADAELLCGMDRASVETAVGFVIDRVEGSLESGECTLWPEEGAFLREWVLVARVIDASSDEAVRSRGAIEGTSSAGGVRTPDVVYDGVLGGAWRLERRPDATTSTAGATSTLFAGDRAIVLTSDVNAEGRDAPTDLLALSRQLAVSQGLTLDPAP